jgi:hypothetical protein
LSRYYSDGVEPPMRGYKYSRLGLEKGVEALQH